MSSFEHLNWFVVGLFSIKQIVLIWKFPVIVKKKYDRLHLHIFTSYKSHWVHLNTLNGYNIQCIRLSWFIHFECFIVFREFKHLSWAFLLPFYITSWCRASTHNDHLTHTLTPNPLNTTLSLTERQNKTIIKSLQTHVQFLCNTPTILRQW